MGKLDKNVNKEDKVLNSEADEKRKISKTKF